MLPATRVRAGTRGRRAPARAPAAGRARGGRRRGRARPPLTARSTTSVPSDQMQAATSSARKRPTAPRDPLAEVSIRYQTVKNTLEWSTCERLTTRITRGASASAASAGRCHGRRRRRGEEGRVGRRDGEDQGVGAHDPDHEQQDREGRRGRRRPRTRGDAPTRRARRRANIHPSTPAPTASTIARPATAPKRASAGIARRPGGRPRQQPAQGQQVGGGEGGEEGDRPQADGAQARRRAARGPAAGARGCRASTPGPAAAGAGARGGRWWGAGTCPRRRRLPSAAGTVSAPSSAPRRSLAELATISRRSAVGSRPSRRGDSERAESVTAVSPAAIAAPWSPKVWGTPRRRSWPAERRRAVGPPAGARHRAVGDVPQPERLRVGAPVEPDVHPVAVGLAGRVEHDRRGERERREALEEPAQPRVAQRAAVGRDEEVGPLVAGGARRLGQAQQHRGGAGAGGHPRRRVAGRDDEDAAQGTSAVGRPGARRRRSAGPPARRRRAPAGPGRAPCRPAPGTCASCPCTQRAACRSWRRARRAARARSPPAGWRARASPGRRWSTAGSPPAPRPGSAG